MSNNQHTRSASASCKSRSGGTQSDKGTWYSVIPARSYKAGRRNLEGDRQSRLRRPADDGQAARPGTHVDHHQMQADAKARKESAGPTAA